MELRPFDASIILQIQPITKEIYGMNECTERFINKVVGISFTRDIDASTDFFSDIRFSMKDFAKDFGKSGTTLTSTKCLSLKMNF